MVRVAILGPDGAAPADGVAIRLHPVGTKARGWGYEPDTKAALAWLEKRVKPGMTVCDIGTGTGILALVAAKLGAVVTAYESDDAVREIAAQNIKLNKLDITLHGAWRGSGQGSTAVPYDLVVANLGTVDYEELGILKAGTEVWTSG